MRKTIYCIVDIVAEEPISTFLANNSNQAKLAFKRICEKNSEDGIILNLYSCSDFYVDRYSETDIIADCKNNLQLIASFPDEQEIKLEKKLEEEINEHIGSDMRKPGS